MKVVNGLICYEGGENPFELFPYKIATEKTSSQFGYKLVSSGKAFPEEYHWIEATEEDHRKVASIYYGVPDDKVVLTHGCYLQTNGQCTSFLCVYTNSHCEGPFQNPSTGVLTCLCGQ